MKDIYYVPKVLVSSLSYDIEPLLSLIGEISVMSSFDIDFLKNIRYRWLRQEGDTTLSERQVAVLDGIYRSAMRKGLLNGSYVRKTEVPLV